MEISQLKNGSSKRAYISPTLEIYGDLRSITEHISQFGPRSDPPHPPGPYGVPFSRS